MRQPNDPYNNNNKGGEVMGDFADDVENAIEIEQLPDEEERK